MTELLGEKLAFINLHPSQIDLHLILHLGLVFYCIGTDFKYGSLAFTDN